MTSTNITALTSAARNPYAAFLGEKNPMRVLAATPARLKKVVEGLTPRQIACRPQPDKWSIAEMVAHLADVELVFNVRCRLMLFEENPTLAPFAQDAWMRGWQREREPFAETMNRFQVLRRSMLRLLRGASASDLARTGRHVEYGTEQVSDYVAKLAGHDLSHLTGLEALRKRMFS